MVDAEVEEGLAEEAQAAAVEGRESAVVASNRDAEEEDGDAALASLGPISCLMYGSMTCMMGLEVAKVAVGSAAAPEVVVVVVLEAMVNSLSQTLTLASMMLMCGSCLPNLAI